MNTETATDSQIDNEKKEYLYQEETYKIIGCCMEVHKTLGPGFSEIVFKDALEIEFKLNDIPYEREKVFTVDYKSHLLPHCFGVDFICYDKIVLEVKAQKKMIDDHYNQTINYLAVSKNRVGLAVNFGEKSLAFKRVAL